MAGELHRRSDHTARCRRSVCAAGLAPARSRSASNHRRVHRAPADRQRPTCQRVRPGTCSRSRRRGGRARRPRRLRPRSEAAIDWVRRNATYAVRGNHDEAVASGAPTGASERLVDVAEESAAWTRARLADADRHFLGSLPLHAEFSFAVQRSPRSTPPRQIRFAPISGLIHQTSAGSRACVRPRRVAARGPHSPSLHAPVRIADRPQSGRRRQPRDGIPLADYMIWEDGDVFLHAKEGQRGCGPRNTSGAKRADAAVRGTSTTMPARSKTRPIRSEPSPPAPMALA